MPDRRSKTLDAYGEKRDFGRTPEPRPEESGGHGAEVSPAAGPQFVVHRHEARRLHYDLRLEMQGVLRSWAVPRGFSYDPEVKKLAVRTEDHPIRYTSFEGVIPEGEYGGGTMVIWDRGSYQITEGGEDQGVAGVEAGKLVVRLSGRKLRGAWHLVRTKRGPDEWLLFKGRDRYARQDSERQPFFDLRGARKWSGEPPPLPLRPQEERAAFTDRNWIFEPELDGVPVFLERRRGQVRLEREDDRRPIRVTEIAAEAERLRAESFLARGTLVSTDAAERPSAARLAERLSGNDSVPVSLYLNDLLRYEEWDVRSVPLLERKELLTTLLPPGERILLGEHVAVRGEEFHAACEAAGLPGAIARRSDSAYPTTSKSAAAAGEPDCLRLPSRAARAPDPADHLLLGLSRQRAARESARPIRFTNLDKVFWPGPATRRAT